MENLVKLNNNTVQPIKSRLLKVSFYITYAFLLTTGTITFIEAMRNRVPAIRHILNLETCISIVAAFFYSQFMKKVNDATKAGKEVNFREINMTRYTDWMITTPIMILVLCLVLGYNNNTTVRADFFLLLLLVNFAMLGAGYLGEVGITTRKVGGGLGFVFFFLLYGLIYMRYLAGNYNFDNQIIFWAFTVFWAFYGVFYYLDEKTKNVGYNVLDLFSKCFVGIFFWAYLTGVIKIF